MCFLLRRRTGNTLRKTCQKVERERETRESLASHTKENQTQILLCCLGSRRLFIGILWQRVPARRHFTGQARAGLRRISAFALCACLFLQSVFCLNQYQCKRLRRLITATHSARTSYTHRQGTGGRMINALHCGMVRWRVNND